MFSSQQVAGEAPRRTVDTSFVPHRVDAYMSLISLRLLQITCFFLIRSEDRRSDCSNMALWHF